MGRLKVLGFRYLPMPLLAALKRYHYRRVFAAATMDDEPEFRVMAQLVRAGETVVDVGAHIGTHTKMLAQIVGPSGRVYAIEPTSLTFRILTENVRQMGCSHVECLNLAISDHAGSVAMEIPRTEDGADGSYFARVLREVASPAAHVEKVRAETLDFLLGRLTEPVAFIKMDVEGHELECIRGSFAILERWRPALLVEVTNDPDQPGSRAEHLFTTLRTFAYECYMLKGNTLKIRRTGDRGLNYFFLTKQHASRLNAMVAD